MKTKNSLFGSFFMTKLFLVIALVTGSSNAWGVETLTYYPNATAGSEYVPFRPAYSNRSGYKTEFIIPSKDLAAMAGKKVTKLTFYNKTTTTNSLGTYKICLKEVNDSVFSETTYLGDYSSPVYNGTIDGTSDNWTITLTSDFIYSGNKHLLIGFYYNGDGDNTSSIYFWAFNFGTGKNKTLYPNYSGNATYHTYAPKTTFTYEDVSDDPVEVSAPTGLDNTATTPTSATFNWTKGDDETTWQMSYSTTSGNHETTTSDFTDKPYTLTGLTPSTTYYVSIRAKKSSTYSDWSTETSFTTDDAIAVTSVTVSPTSWKMLAGDTKPLSVTVSPDNATYKSVTWESDDTSVATVSSTGVVTAVAPGTCNITVKSTSDNTKQATCEITVTAPVTPTAFKTKELTKDYVYLTWTNGSTETTWQIKYGTSSNNLNQTSGDINNSKKPYLITGLSSNTTYYASIRSKLGTAYSDWSDETSFTTPSFGSDPAGTVTTEEFGDGWTTSNGKISNGGIKDGWGYSGSYTSYYISTGFKYGDDGNGLYYLGSAGSDYIIMPAVKAGTTISFYASRAATYNWATYTVKLYKAIKVGSKFYIDTSVIYADISPTSTTMEENTSASVTEGGYVAILLGYCAIDHITYTAAPSSVSAITDNNGYTTFASSEILDLTSTNMPSGLTAYKAAVEGSIVKFTALDQTVPSNTGVLLEGEANTQYQIAIADEGTTVTNNAFNVNSTGYTFAPTDGYTYFALKKNSNPLTFAKFAPNSIAIPSSKAYLKILTSEVDGRELTLLFDDDNTTDIKNVNKTSGHERYFNLAGQQVKNPTKGLYIVNGKKTVIK